MKKTSLQRAIDAIEQDITVLRAALDRLRAQQALQHPSPTIPKRKRRVTASTPDMTNDAER